MPEPGRFTHLSLENWRNFTKVQITLGQRVFVVGSNAAGKSNLLDAFRFLHDIAVPGGGLRRALEESRQGLKHVRSLHARRGPARVRIGALIDGSQWSYELAVSRDPKKKSASSVIVQEIVTCDGRKLINRPNDRDNADELLLTQTYLEQNSQNQKFRPLAEFLASVQYTHVVPQLVRNTSPDDRKRFGEALGADFVEQIAQTPKKARTSRLKVVQAALRQVLPRFEELQDTRDDLGRPHLKAKYQHWRAPGAWQTEEQFSDGTLRLLGVLWYLTGEPAPLILEEPELSLHPAAVRQLPRLLATAAAKTGRQVLISTHSPDLLGDTGIDPTEVVLLRPGKEGTDVSLASDEAELVEAARRDEPLGSYLEALTRPEHVLKLADFGGRG